MSPLLVNPADAAVLIGAKCGGSSPDYDDPSLVATLQALTSRMEAAMNVDSLSLGTHVDRFYLNEKPLLSARGPVKASLRLSNGYIDASSLILKDEDGVEIEAPTSEKVDTKYGIVDLFDWERGYYSLEYDSGFEVTDGDDPKSLIGLPDWVLPAVTAFLVQWYRVMYLSPKTPKGLSYEQTMAALYRQIQSLVYPHYQRPRLNVVWGTSLS